MTTVFTRPAEVLDAAVSRIRRDTLIALDCSCQYITETLVERFGTGAAFELDTEDGFFQDNRAGHYDDLDVWVTWPFVVLAGWMTIDGVSVAEVTAYKSVKSHNDEPQVAVHVTTPRRWRRPKRTEVSDSLELRAALGI